MVRTLPSALLQRALDILGDEPFVWLWVITIDQTATASPAFCLARYPESVTFNIPGEGSSTVFDPAPMNVGAVKTVRDGSMVSLDVSIASVFGGVNYWLDVGDGFMGMPATAYVVDLNNLEEGPLFSMEFTCGSVSEDHERIVLTMQTPNYFKRRVPVQTLTRDRCQRRFKDRGCGYIGTTETSCDKTLVRCGQIGDSEVADGFVRLHPERFLAAPGIQLLS